MCPRRESAEQSQCHRAGSVRVVLQPIATLELPGVGQVLLVTLFPSSGNCPRKTPEEIEQSQQDRFVMWECDVTARWRSFTQGDAGMRQGWTQLLRQGGHSTEKPRCNQGQVSLRMALGTTGMQLLPEEGPWHLVGASCPWGQLQTLQMTLL